MKNIINYYYNLFPNEIINNDNYFSFNLDNEIYHFVIYDRNIEEKEEIFNINTNMINNNIPVHEIIKNKQNEIITFYEDIPYVLYKVYINVKKEISLPEINYMSYSSYNNNDLKWINLWINRIDYLEKQISQIGKKYPIILNSFSYYIGLSENAISYLQNTLNETTKEEIDKFSYISHKKIYPNDTIYNLYNPLNIIYDHKARDLAEYIKSSFFKNNNNIFKELDEYFKYNYFSIYAIKITIARILFPNYYFDLYDLIIQDKTKEKEIINITNKSNEFEKYLKNIFLYFSKFYKIPQIEWIIKKWG